MKKIFVFSVLFGFLLSSPFASSFTNFDTGFSKLALRDISESSNSDLDDESEEADSATYKSTKRLRGWAHSLTLGLYIPISDFKIEYSGYKLDAEHTAVAFSVGGISMNLENGFTLKYNYNIGGGHTDEIWPDMKQNGFDMSFNFALGWAPLRKEHFRMALLAGLGYQLDYISGDGPYEAQNGKYYTGEYSDFLWDLNIGGELLMIAQFNKHFGLYFDLGIKGILTGSDKGTLTDLTGHKTNYDAGKLSGSRVIPSFGAVISF